MNPQDSIYPRSRWVRAMTLAALLTSPVLAQNNPPTTDQVTAKSESAKPVQVASAEEPVKLSPFTVRSDKDSGYFTANTLAGTRLNNNIADLPSSITVVTKQQMDDTGSLNINDVFRYEASTEGASTYTPFVLVRSNVQDALGGGGGTTGNYTSAITTGNRVRGLSTADQEEDNFFSLYRIPFDAYNTQAIEILRGPNSIIFGTGSPAGIVNQERIQANTDHSSLNLKLTTDNWGSVRESVNANIPLIKDQLGIFAAQVYDSRGFKQKPASDITRRQYAAITYYPFKNHKTKITGSIENYNNYANDPNGVTPIDFVTPWVNSGKPMWNPLTDIVTYANGTTKGPYALSSAYPNYQAPITQALLTNATSPYFIPSLTFVATSHNVMQINNGNLESFYRAGQTGLSIPGWVPATNTMNAAQLMVNQQRMTITTNLPNPAGYQTWYFPGVTSKDVYDWSSVNVNSLNNTYTRAKTFNLSLEQEILPDLHAQVAWFRQELKQIQDAPLAQANATTLYVDTNSYLFNGDRNDHAGQPFVDVYASDVYSEPEVNDNWRAMLAYTPDFRDKLPNWLSWIGHHRLMGVYTRHDDVATNLRYRPAIISGDPNYLPTAAALSAASGYSLASSNSALEQWVYMSRNSSPGMYNRPGYGGDTSANVKTYNYATGQWVNTTVNMDSVLFNTGGRNQSVLDSSTFFWQSFLWDDRLVGSVGVNKDKVKNRSTLFPATNPLATLYTNGLPNTQYWYVYGPWNYVEGTTHTLGAVLHAFKGWRPIDRAADGGNYAMGFLRSLSFTYNKSDNFNPPGAFYTDYFGTPLGKPVGKEKDYGIEIATPDNKLFLRATWFQTTSKNAIVTLTSTARANYIDQTELKNWATTVVEIRNGQNPSDPNFGNTNINPITAAMQSQIAALTGLPYNYGGNVGENGQFVAPNAAEDGVAKGVEMEVTYNPTRNWTMKFTYSHQKTTVSGAAAQAQAWVDHRYGTWQKYVAADLPTVYTKANGSPLYVGNFWQAYGYDSNVTGPGNINGWTNTQNYYNIVVGSQLAIDEANNGALAPNQRQDTWRFLTNYTFDEGMLKHLSVGAAVRYDGRATAGYYGDTTHLNSTGQVAAPDINRPLYTPAKTHYDLWAAYTVHLPWVSKNTMCKIQLNVADVTSNGYLLPISYNFDGSPAAERIIQPRTYTLSTDFSF